MSSDKKKKLEMTVAAIQRRWGLRAISRSTEAVTTIPHIATTFPELDAALGIGGIPRGRITEMIGVPTSGMATVALKIMTQAQAHHGTAVYIDVEQTFDPDYARRCGVNLNRLILVHPYNVAQALAMLPDFVINGGLELLIFDMPARLHVERPTLLKLSTTLGRLLAPLNRSESALLFLTALPPASASSLDAYPRHAALPHYAAVRLLIQKERWLYHRRDVAGYAAQVVVVKNKFGPTGKQARVAITFNGTVDGDGT